MEYIAKVLEFIVYFIIFIKVVFLIATIGHIIFSHYNKGSSLSKMLDIKFSYWKRKTEFIFIFSMSLLLIYIFNPWYKHRKYITRELEILFYLFGYILLFTADWSTFLSESIVFKQISNALK